MSNAEARLLANIIQTPDGTILQSFHRHDYKTHKDANGRTYMVDGGFEYSRGVINDIPERNLSVYSDDPHELIREHFHWGTRGKDGRSPLEYKSLKSLTNNHIQAIIDTQHHIPDFIYKVFDDELEYRLTNNIHFED